MSLSLPTLALPFDAMCNFQAATRQRRPSGTPKSRLSARHNHVKTRQGFAANPLSLKAGIL